MGYIKILLFVLLPLFCTSQMVYNDQSNATKWSNYSSVDFDGSSSYLSAAHNENLYFDINSPFSIELWVKPIPSTDNGNTAIAFAKNKGDSIISIKIIDANTSRPYVRFQLGGTNYYRAEASTDNSAVLNKLWQNFYYHVVCVYDGSDTSAGLSIYINGTNVSESLSFSGTPEIIGSDSLYIGYDPDNQAHTKIGYCTVRVFSVALTYNDVSELFNSGTPMPVKSGLSKVFEHSVLANFSSHLKNIAPGDVKTEPFFPGNLKKGVYRGGVISAHAGHVFGSVSSFNNSYVSPVTSDWGRTNMIYDGTNNTTYIATMARSGVGFRRDAIFFAYDHNNDKLSNIGRLANTDTEEADGHLRASITKSKDSGYIASRESPGHNDGGKVAKGPFSGMSEISTWASPSAYYSFFYLNSDLFAFFRKGGTYQAQAFVKSPNNGETWGGNTTIVNDETGNWSYPSVIVDNDSVAYLFVNSRTGLGGEFEAIYCYKTFDMDSIYTMSDSLIADVGTADLVSGVDLRTFCLIDSVTTAPTDYLDFLDAVIDTSGTLHVLYEETEMDSIFLASWSGSGWSYQPINIPLGVTSTLNGACLFYLGGDSFSIFKIELRGSTRSIVKYTTEDAFATVSAGEVISKPGVQYSHITTVSNKPFGGPYLIAGSEQHETATETSYLFIYEYTP